MSRVRPIVFQQPGLALGQIVIRGANRASEILGQGKIELEARQDDMRNKRDTAEQYKKNVERLTSARIEASEGPIDEMTNVVEKASEELQADIDKFEDPALHANLTNALTLLLAQTMSNTLLMQNSRNVGRSIAVGEELLETLDGAVQDGSTTANEAHQVMTLYGESQKDNVYGEDIEETIESWAKQLAETQFNVLLKSNPKAALEYPDGEFAKKWLKPRERRELKSIANNSVVSTLANIDARGAAIQSSDLPDREERLEALNVEIMQQPDIPRRKLSATRNEAWRSESKKRSVTKADRIRKFSDILNDLADGPLPQDQSTLNGAYEQEKNAGSSIAEFISTLTEKGSDYPDSFISDFKRDGKSETLNLGRQQEQLAVMPPDRANLVASFAGVVSETAYGATKHLTNAAERAERNAVLGRANSVALIENADKLLEDDDLRDAIRGRFPIIVPVGGALFVLPGIKVSNPLLAPSQNAEIRDNYRFQFVAQQGNFSATEADALKKSALKVAGQEFLDNHLAMPIAIGLFSRRRYFIPRSSISFNQTFSEETAIKEMVPLISSLMRTAGHRSGLLSGNPIIDRVRARTAFAVTNTAGIIGFVEWDGNSGLARTIRPSDPEEFASLTKSMTNMRTSLNPNPGFVTPPGQKMTPQTADDVMDVAFSIFREQNNGRAPITDADEATLISIAESIAAANP